MQKERSIFKMKQQDKLKQAITIINQQNVVLKVILGSMDMDGNIELHLRKQGLIEIIEESQNFMSVTRKDTK